MILTWLNVKISLGDLSEVALRVLRGRKQVGIGDYFLTIKFVICTFQVSLV